MPFNKRKEVCGKPTQYNLQTCEYNWRELSDVHFKIEERNRRIRNPLYYQQEQQQQQMKENIISREGANVSSVQNVNNDVKNNGNVQTSELQSANRVERHNQEVQTPELLTYLHNLEPRNNVHSNRSSPALAGNEQYYTHELLSPIDPNVLGRNQQQKQRSSPPLRANNANSYTSNELYEVASPVYRNKYNNNGNNNAPLQNNYNEGDIATSHDSGNNNNMGNVVLYYSSWSHEELRRLTYSNDAEARHSYLNRFAAP